MRIVRYESLRGWRPVVMTMPLEQQLACPACEVPLSIICEIKGTQTIRVGTCDSCGYMGYLDRPSKEWMKEFYEHAWDLWGRQSKDDMVAYCKKMPSSRSAGYSWLLDMIQRTKPDRRRPILEIGCGFGETLGPTRQLGFRDAVGVDNSKHRTEVAKEAFGVDVRLGRFEDVYLEDKGPYSVIYSNHVLEHIHDPTVTLKRASALQEPGDYLILGVPNNVGEPSMGVLMFLPHLHSFTATSLMRLLARYNYAATDFVATTNDNLNIIAVRKKEQHAVEPKKGLMQDGVRKLLTGLGITPKRQWLKTKRLVWSRKKDDGKQMLTWLKPRGFEEPRSLIVENEIPKLPLDINFTGNVELFVK